MAPIYEVEIVTTGREVYTVEADSAEEAGRNWLYGDLGVSESNLNGVTKVEEVEC